MSLRNLPYIHTTHLSFLTISLLSPTFPTPHLSSIFHIVVCRIRRSVEGGEDECACVGQPITLCCGTVADQLGDNRDGWYVRICDKVWCNVKWCGVVWCSVV